MSVILNIDSLVVEYDADRYERQRVHAVRGVSFTLNAGEVIGVIGESGCGKTSLLAALARLVPTAGGAMAVGGEDYTNASYKTMRRVRRRLQLVPQDAFGFFDPRLPVKQAIASTIRSLRDEWQEAEARAAIARALDLVGLDPSYLERQPHDLSGGEIKRAALARAIVIEPSVILLDEPFAGLDAETQRALARRLMSMKRSMSIAVILVSHELEPLTALADRLIVMHDGALVASGTVHDILKNPTDDATRGWVLALARRRALSGGTSFAGYQQYATGGS